MVATTLSTASSQRHRDEPGQDGARKTQEEEQHLGVEGVGAGRVEGGTQVVADQTGAGQSRLDVVGPARDSREGGGRIGRKAVVHPPKRTWTSRFCSCGAASSRTEKS